jgi:UDP-N-acetylmuramoyl-L-alanyl-D-glutamate--2,6-diaminopimelate ligase
VSGYPRPRHVAAIPTGDLAAVAGARPRDDDTHRDGLVTGVTHDSSRVQPGDLYVAISGSTRHGAEFADQVISAGAVAILTDDSGAARIRSRAVPVLVVDDPRAVLGVVAAQTYGDPTARLPIIGITGTAGKTSSAYLIESGLAADGRVTCMIGTVETRIAGETLDSVRTTPEATDLHALLAVALERGATAAVMEVSSHALAFGRVGGVRFEVGGFTNFGQDHLDFHSDVEDYFAAKARLFDGRCRVEVLNLDDPAVRRLVRPDTSPAVQGQRRQITFSALGDPAATWRAEDISRSGREARGASGSSEAQTRARGASASEPRSREQTQRGREQRHYFGQSFTAVHRDLGSVPVSVSLPGRHNVANALLALASLVEVGVSPQVAAEGIAACRGVPGRLELVGAPGPVLGVVDYAHKPDAIVAALAALRDVTGSAEASTGEDGSAQASDASGAGQRRSPGRLLCVIGAGGDRDRGKRPLMGAAAAHGADLVLVTDDNPRSEDPAAIRAEVLAGINGGTPVIEVAGRREAIAEAVRLAEPGDVVVLLGKGHERGQEIAGVVTPFDDRVELATALAHRFAEVSL